MTTYLAGGLTKPYKGIRPAALTRSEFPPFAPLGYCVGAKNWKRYRSTLKFSLVFVFSLSTVLTLLCYLFTGQTVSVFLTEAAAYPFVLCGKIFMKALLSVNVVL